jgi:hypothetical protein
MGFVGDFFEDVFDFGKDIVDFMVDGTFAPFTFLADLFVPDIPDFDSGGSPTYNSDRIGNTISEGVMVSRCYGKCKIGGNKIRFNDPDATDLRLIVAHCLGEVEGIIEWQVNDIEWSELTGSHTKTEYTGTRTQTADARFSSRAGAYRDMAYTAFTFVKDDKQVGYNPNITVIMEGLKCAPMAGGADAFTRNPAVILYDWYLNVEDGYSAGDLDLNAFKSLEELCDEVPTGGTLPRYRFDFNIDSNMPINDVKKLIWASFNGRSIMSQGTIKPIWDSGQMEDGAGSLTAKTVSHAFDLDNIVKDSFTWRQLEKPNVVRVKFKDLEKNYKTATVEEKDEYDIDQNGEILYEETAWFLTDAELARRRTRFKYNKKRYADYACSLTALSGASDIEVLDLVTVTHALPGWTTKQFIVMSRSEDAQGKMRFVLEAYYSGMYDDAEVGTQASYESNLPNPFKTPAPSTSISAASTTVGTAYDFDAVRVLFTPPTGDPFYYHTAIYASNDNSTYYFVGNDNTGTFTFNALGVIYEPGDTCYIKLRSVSTNNVMEDLPGSADASLTIPSTARLAGFYTGTNDFWGGASSSISDAATKIVLGNLDGTPKIALGGTADSLTLTNAATFPGFFVDGDGYMRAGGSAGYFKWDGTTFEIKGTIDSSIIDLADCELKNEYGATCYPFAYYEHAFPGYVAEYNVQRRFTFHVRMIPANANPTNHDHDTRRFLTPFAIANCQFEIDIDTLTASDRTTICGIALDLAESTSTDFYGDGGPNPSTLTFTNLQMWMGGTEWGDNPCTADNDRAADDRVLTYEYLLNDIFDGNKEMWLRWRAIIWVQDPGDNDADIDFTIYTRIKNI